MEPQEALKEEMLKLLENDYNELKQLVEHIITTKNLDKKKLGRAYFLTQRIDMELYRLILTFWPKS